MNKRYGIPLHSIVCSPCFDGDFARVFRARHKRVGPSNAPEYIQPLLIQGVCPPGSDEDFTSLQVKKPHRRTWAHIWWRPPLPCPSSDAGAACVLSSPSAPALHGAASCPSPFPLLPFDPLPFVVCAPRVRASRAFPFPRIACGQVAKSHAKHSSCRVQRMGREGPKAALPLHPLNGNRKGTAESPSLPRPNRAYHSQPREATHAIKNPHLYLLLFIPLCARYRLFRLL